MFVPGYYIKTFGCQQNKSDSERIEGDYLARGYTPTTDWKTADEIIINTCAVRQRAEDRVKGFVLNVTQHFHALKCPTPKIILTGCMTHHGEQKLMEMIPGIDEILPINEVGFNQAAVRRDKVHAWIPVSEGCNSFCTYCIVPYSRGRERSRPMEEVLTEIEILAKQGYRHITLLGQNVNSYGLEKVGVGYRKLLMSKSLHRSRIPSNQSQYLRPAGTPPFVKLLREITAIPDIQKVQFLTSNPWDFHDELIEEIACNSKIDRFIHLPVQSGSDRILSLMNRGYTSADYLHLVRKLRKAAPDVTIGTDIIVGFPTETDDDFSQTVSLAKESKWIVAFVAQYSPRPGTAAWRIYPDDVPPEVKKQRWETLDQLINKSQLHQRPIIK